MSSSRPGGTATPWRRPRRVGPRSEIARIVALGRRGRAAHGDRQPGRSPTQNFGLAQCRASMTNPPGQPVRPAQRHGRQSRAQSTATHASGSRSSPGHRGGRHRPRQVRPHPPLDDVIRMPRLAACLLARVDCSDGALKRARAAAPSGHRRRVRRSCAQVRRLAHAGSRAVRRLVPLAGSTSAAVRGAVDHPAVGVTRRRRAAGGGVLVLICSCNPTLARRMLRRARSPPTIRPWEPPGRP